jgi:hypothetical protein
MPQPLAEDERVAAEDDGDVVIPAAKRPRFVVVEPELALEVLVDPLGAPALFGDPHELLAARLFGGGSRLNSLSHPDRDRICVVDDTNESMSVDNLGPWRQNRHAMTLAELLEQQAMALPAEERKALAAKLLASAAAPAPPQRRRAGSAAGRIHMAPDFDAPLEDFADYS